jgi:hypothetical protein
MTNYFPASMDRTTRWLSVLVLLTLVIVTVLVGSEAPRAVLWRVLGLNLLIVGLSWGWAPRGYDVDGERLVVKRPLGSVTLPLASLQEATAAEYDDLGWVLRTFGNGGLFGWYGRFHSSGLGHHRWYASRRSGLVVLRWPDRTVVISPDDRERFLAALPVPHTVGLRPRGVGILA